MCVREKKKKKSNTKKSEYALSQRERERERERGRVGNQKLVVVAKLVQTISRNFQINRNLTDNHKYIPAKTEVPD